MELFKFIKSLSHFTLITLVLLRPCSTLFTNSCHPVVPVGWVDSQDLEGTWNQVLSSEDKHDGYNHCVSMFARPIESQSSVPGYNFNFTKITNQQTLRNLNLLVLNLAPLNLTINSAKMMIEFKKNLFNYTQPHCITSKL